MGDPGSLTLRRRAVRERIARLRSQARLRIAFAVLWAFQAGVGGADRPGWIPLLFGAAAVVSAATGVRSWRALPRERHRLEGLVGVDLRPVAEGTLSRLVAAALEGAAADEVTPPVTPGQRWSPERIEWLRAFHRDRRAGLDGPAGEVTWAVVEVTPDEDEGTGRVVGSVRLRRTGEPGGFETGIWLVRDARGRGIGTAAMQLLLQRAREAGATTVRAETTTTNAGSAALLRSLGFAATVEGEHVRAELPLT